MLAMAKSVRVTPSISAARSNKRFCFGLTRASILASFGAINPPLPLYGKMPYMSNFMVALRGLAAIWRKFPASALHFPQSPEYRCSLTLKERLQIQFRSIS
jgi:hypothetical protein